MKNGLSSFSIIILISILASITCLRNLVWQNEITLWADAAAKSPNRAQPTYELALAYARSGNNDKAFPLMQRVFELDPAFVTKSLDTSAQKTIEEYQHMLRINPKQPIIHNQLGMAYFDKGLLMEAINEYRLSLALEPSESAVHCNLGIAYYEMRMPEAAIKEFQEAIRLNSQDPEPHARLAIVYVSIGKLDGAVDELRRALRINPEHVGSKKLLNDTMQLMHKKEQHQPRNLQ